MSRPFHFSRFYHPNDIGWWVEIINLLIMKFSPLPCYLVPLRPKYSPQYSTLKHPQPTFLPQCDRPRFTPIQLFVTLKYVPEVFKIKFPVVICFMNQNHVPCTISTGSEHLTIM
jgi:hypothetical protein